MMRFARFYWLLSAVFAASLDAQGATVYLTPNDSIQKAIDRAANGDSIILRDGTYYETIAISKSIALKAEHGGKATLSNAYRGKLQFAAEKGALGLYSARAPWPVRWVMVGDRFLYDYIDLANLLTFTVQPKYSRLSVPREGFHEGFTWADGKLYIRLEGNADPNSVPIEVNSSKMDGQSQFMTNAGLAAEQTFVRPLAFPILLVYDPRNSFGRIKPVYYGTAELGVLVSVRADDVVIEGLRIHLAPHVGVDVRDSKRVTIRDCFFDGFQYAVNTWQRSEDLTVEYCEFSGGRLYQRMRAAMAGRGGGDTWGTIYWSRQEINIVAQKGPGFVFQHNFVYEGFDGIQPRGIATDLIGKVPDKPSDISYNIFMNIGDNNLEPDGWTRLLNLRVHHNLIVDGYDLLSCAPTQRGPLTVDHNIFYNSPENGLSGGNLVKLGQPQSSFDLNTGLVITHNTFVEEGKGLVSRQAADFQDNVLENNIMVCSRGDWELKGWTPSKYNLVFGTDTLPQCIHSDPKFVSKNPIDFRLSESSPARGAGVIRDAGGQEVGGTDLGAIPFGGKWDFPKPGPRWATPENMPQRPVWPASISPEWGGFAKAAMR